MVFLVAIADAHEVIDAVDDTVSHSDADTDGVLDSVADTAADLEGDGVGDCPNDVGCVGVLDTSVDRVNEVSSKDSVLTNSKRINVYG